MIKERKVTEKIYIYIFRLVIIYSLDKFKPRFSQILNEGDNSSYHPHIQNFFLLISHFIKILLLKIFESINHSFPISQKYSKHNKMI